MNAVQKRPEKVAVCVFCLGDILKGEALVRDRKGNPLHAWCKGED